MIKLKSFLNNKIFKKYNQKEYFSQDGEDFLLCKIIATENPGFFVDIGAAHPIKGNNTYYFYRRGWRGLCVDASPGLESLYQKQRPEDRFINAFVGKNLGRRELFIFNEPFLNTGSPRRKEFLTEKTKYKFQEQVTVQQLPLKEILKKNIPPEQTIEFMSLDVEEAELEVLESNDWDKYRPRVIMMEVLHQDREKIGEAPQVRFLKEHGYRPIIILQRSVFFINV